MCMKLIIVNGCGAAQPRIELSYHSAISTIHRPLHGAMEDELHHKQFTMMQ